MTHPALARMTTVVAPQRSRHAARTRGMRTHGSTTDTLVLPRLRLLTACALFVACAGDEAATTVGRETFLNDFSCRSCMIVVDTIAWVGHPDDTLALKSGYRPAMDSRGRFYVPDADQSAVHVFRPDGRLLTTFGRAGHGPGEFSRIRDITVVEGDTLLIASESDTHIIAPDYSHVRQYKRRGVRPAAVLARSRLLFSGGTGPNQFYLVDINGVREPAIKLKDADTTTCAVCSQRFFAESNVPGSIWSGSVVSYAVEHYDLSGNLLHRFVRKTDWLLPAERSKELGATDEDFFTNLALPRLMGVRQGTDGILWTHLTKVEDMAALKGLDLFEPAGSAEFHSAMVTTIEAIDPQRKQLLAGIKLAGPVYPLARDYSALLIEEGNGEKSWRVLRFTMRKD